MNHYQDDVYMTSDGIARMQAELEELKADGRAHVARLIHEAKEAGDISENAAYDEAKDQQAMLEGRIRRLEEILSRARTIQVDANRGSVALGHTVTVAETGEDPETFLLVGSAEADPTKGAISNESPLGRALLGKRIGETATYVGPTGDSMTFTILDIS